MGQKEPIVERNVCSKEFYIQLESTTTLYTNVICVLVTSLKRLKGKYKKTLC